MHAKRVTSGSMYCPKSIPTVLIQRNTHAGLRTAFNRTSRQELKMGVRESIKYSFQCDLCGFHI